MIIPKWQASFLDDHPDTGARSFLRQDRPGAEVNGQAGYVSDCNSGEAGSIPAFTSNLRRWPLPRE